MRVLMQRAAVVASVLAALWGSTSSIAAPYSITGLSTLGGKTSIALGINNSGQVVGEADTSTGASHAFLYSGGTMTDLGTLAGTSSSATAINNNGQITGTSDGSDSQRHAFIYSGGNMSALNDPFDIPPHYSNGNAINSSGVVAGLWNADGAYFSNNSWQILDGAARAGRVLGINDTGQMAVTLDTQNGTHAILYDGGTIHDLGTLGGPSSDARAINSHGDVVGSTSVDTFLAHDTAFLYSNGTMQNLGNLGGLARALAINSSGTVVGGSELNDSSPYHAFIYANGSMQDLNNLIPSGSGWTLNSAFGVNDLGQIAGSGISQGEMQAFLLTPTQTPEPTSLGTIAMGGIALFRRMRRRGG